MAAGWTTVYIGVRSIFSVSPAKVLSKRWWHDIQSRALSGSGRSHPVSGHEAAERHAFRPGCDRPRGSAAAAALAGTRIHGLLLYQAMFGPVQMRPAGATSTASPQQRGQPGCAFICDENSMSALRLLLNLIWIVAGGIWMAAAWLAAAVVLAVTIIGLRWARSAVNVTLYTLLSFGHRVVSRGAGARELGGQRARSGRAAQDRLQHLSTCGRLAVWIEALAVIAGVLQQPGRCPPL